MHEWYDGHKNVRNLQDIESFDTTDVNANNYRQWGQLVKSKANRVGCTVLEYSNDDSKCKTVLCNYSGGIIQHEPIFTIGAPASLCKMGANPKYPGLCNPDEDFSQHKSGKHYFDNNAPESPVVGKWLENGKKFNLRVDWILPKMVDEEQMYYLIEFPIQKSIIKSTYHELYCICRFV